MLSKVQKWGNSQGVRIPKSLLEDSHIKIGEAVDITVKAGKIIVEPTRQIHGRYKIKDLIAKMPKDYKTEEEDWGNPVGQEVW
jgi:antitoxin MazE